MQELDQVTGGRTQIGNVELRAWPFRTKFSNITIRARNYLDQPFILSVDSVDVHPHVWGLLLGRLAFDQVVIEHPVVQTFTHDQDKDAIPRPSLDARQSHNMIVGLNIGHFILRNGEITYVHKKRSLAANVYGLDMQIYFEDHPRQYHGLIAYRDGMLRYDTYAPLRNSLNIKFSGTPSRSVIDSASVSIGSSTLLVHGEFNHASQVKFDGNFEARVRPQDFVPHSALFGLGGSLQLTGGIRYESIAARPWLLNLSLSGQVGSDALTVTSRNRELQFHKIHAHYEINNGALQARDIVAELLGGQVGADLAIEHLESTRNYRLKSFVTGADLTALQLAISDSRHENIFLSGTLDGMVDAWWTETLANARLNGSLRVQPAVANRTTPQTQDEFPIEGTSHFSYKRLQNAVRFNETSLRIAGTDIAVQGEASDHSDLQIHAAAADLHQLNRLLSRSFPQCRNSIDLSGSAALEATMHGSLLVPQVIGRLSAHNLVLHRTRWNNATINFDAGPSRITVQNALLVDSGQGRLSLTGTVALRNWLYVPSNPLEAKLSLIRMPVAELQRLSTIHLPISGDLSANLSVHGSALNPQGSGMVRITNARVFDESVPGVSLDLLAKDSSITTDIRIQLAAGLATGTLTYTPKVGAYRVRVNAPSISLHDLTAFRARNISGVMKASLSGQGMLADPEITAAFDIPHAAFHGIAISRFAAEVQIANHRADLNLTSQIASGAVSLHGFANLTGTYYSEAALDTGTLQLNDLFGLPSADPGEAFQGQTELHASMKGQLKNMAELEAHLSVPILLAKYRSLQIAAATPLRVDYVHSVATLPPFEIQGTGTSMRVHGNLPFDGIAPLSLTADGRLDTSLLSLLDPNLKSSGVVSFDLRTTGALQHPSVQGQIHLQDIALSNAGLPVAVENLNGSLEVANNRVQVSNVSGNLGGGQLAIAGGITYWPKPHFQLTSQATAVRFWYAGGISMLLSGDLALTGSPRASALNGQLLIEKVSFLPDFDLKKLAEHFGAARPPHNAGFADSIKLAVAVQSKEKLSATSAQANVEGNVNLQLIGTAARPVIIGRTDLNSGEIFYGRRRYHIQRSTAVFTDPHETKPTLDVSGTTTVNQYHLTLSFRGPLDKLTTSYTSDPPLSAADIINLLVVGRTTQTADIGGTDSVIASQVAGQFSTKMQRLTGISGLRIDPLIGGSNRNPSARIAIQQQVTKNLLFSFSTDVSQPNGETIEGEYQINKKWSIGATRDPVAGVSVMGRHRTTF